MTAPFLVDDALLSSVNRRETRPWGSPCVTYNQDNRLLSTESCTYVLSQT